jgi:hypothetical protein
MFKPNGIFPDTLSIMKLHLELCYETSRDLKRVFGENHDTSVWLDKAKEIEKRIKILREESKKSK